MLWKDTVEKVRARNSENFKVFDNIEGRNCEEIKSGLRFMAKLWTGCPKRSKNKSEVERAREILDDLERCEGMKKILV